MLSEALRCCHCSRCRSDPPLPFSASASLGKSLDPGLALLSGFDRFCQLKAGLWKGIGGIFTELGRIKGSHHKWQVKVSDLFPLSTFCVRAERGCCFGALLPLYPLSWSFLCSPGGGFVAGFICDLGRGKAHRPPEHPAGLPCAGTVAPASTERAQDIQSHSTVGGSQIPNAPLQVSHCPVISSYPCLLAFNL